MKKVLYSIPFCFLIGCASMVNRPVTGEKIPVPPQFIDKIDFDLTIEYQIDSDKQSNNGKFVSALEESGISLDATSLEPLLATSNSQVTLGELALKGNFPTYATLSFKELEAGIITITIKPTFGGYPVGTINKWILIEAKELLIDKMDKMLNPIGYKYLKEEPLTN